MYLTDWFWVLLGLIVWQIYCVLKEIKHAELDVTLRKD